MLPGPEKILAGWRARFSALRRLVAAGDRDSWIWVLHLKVLSFLLSRYDRDDLRTPGLHAAPPGARPTSTGAKHPASPAPRRPLLPAGTIRALLQDIHHHVERAAEEERRRGAADPL